MSTYCWSRQRAELLAPDSVTDHTSSNSWISKSVLKLISTTSQQTCSTILSKILIMRIKGHFPLQMPMSVKYWTVLYTFFFSINLSWWEIHMENVQNLSYLPYIHTHKWLWAKAITDCHIFFVLFMEIFLSSVVAPGAWMLSHFSPVWLFVTLWM